MAQQLDSSELVSFKELLMANSMQIDAAVQLLIEKKDSLQKLSSLPN